MTRPTGPELSSAFVEQYSQLFNKPVELLAELAAPQILFDESTAPDGIRIQTIFKNNNVLEPYVAVINKLVHEYAKTVHEMRYPGTDVHYLHDLKNLSVSSIEKKLLPKKLVTGRLASMAIQLVANDDLSKKPVLPPNALLQYGRQAPLAPAEFWEPESSIAFVLGGETVIGSRRGMYGCGIALYSAGVRVQMVNQRAASFQHVFAASVTDLPERTVQSLSLWSESQMVAGAVQEAQARNVSGGFETNSK